MVERGVASVGLCAVLAVCFACAPDIVPTTPIETEQVHFAVFHPAWNPRSVTAIGDSLVSVSVIVDTDGPAISVISVFEGAVTPLGEFRWVDVSPAKRVFWARPVAPWPKSVLVFAHDDQRNAVVLDFSADANPGVLWQGSCGMHAEMVYDSGRDSLVVLDHRTLTTIGSDGRAEKSELEVAISQPAPFGEGFLAKAGDGFALVEDGVLLSQESMNRRNRVLQVSAAGDSAILVSARWVSDQECVEVLSGGPGSRRCQYGRLPDGVWRVRSYGGSAVLWDLDRRHILQVDCGGFRALQWDSSVVEGMVWATAGDDGLIISDKDGYAVLTSL